MVLAITDYYKLYFLQNKIYNKKGTRFYIFVYCDVMATYGPFFSSQIVCVDKHVHIGSNIIMKT